MKTLIGTMVITLSLLSFTAWFVLAGSIDPSTDLNQFNAGEKAVALQVNDNFNFVAGEVTDNDTRITDLESGGWASGIGRVFLPPSGGQISLPLGPTTNEVRYFHTGIPGDYVPQGGANDVTYKVLITGCAGSNVRYIIRSTSENIGQNSSFSIIPFARTVSIPVAVLFEYTLVAVEETRTGFGDRTTFSFTRLGADAADTCSTDLSLRGVIVEYPTTP